MNTNRKLTIGFAAARIAYAAAGIAAPGRAIGPWLGGSAERGGGRVATRALLGRDALISAGFAIAAWRGGPTRAWLATAVASDLGDIAATIADRRDLPQHSVPGAVALAGGAAVAGAALIRHAEN